MSRDFLWVVGVHRHFLFCYLHILSHEYKHCFSFACITDMQSPELEQQIRSLGSTVHVFGHTHMNYDTTIKARAHADRLPPFPPSLSADVYSQAIRYVQNAFGHPSERSCFSLQRLATEPKLIWSASSSSARQPAP
jgi:hypothetical protein